MSSFPADWFLCGGWAVDTWLNQQTRDHGDIDISIFDDGQRALFEHLAGWNLIPHDAVFPENKEFWDGATLELPAHIHARPPGAENREIVLRAVTPPFTAANDGSDFEFILNERQGPDWLLSGDPRVALPADTAIRKSASGVPVVAPEVLMLFKAAAYWGPNPLAGQAMQGHPRKRDERDFLALAPLLASDEATWLAQAMETLHPGHPWLERLQS